MPRVDKVRICTGYRLRGKVYDYLPSHAADQAAVEPIYEEMPGWSESTVGVKSMDGLPANALAYVKRLEVLIGTPIAMVSTGPERDETIVLQDPFE